MTPEEITLQGMIVVAAGISTVVNMMLLLWNLFSGPSRKNGARLDSFGAAMDEVVLRVAAIEQTQRALPDKDDIHELDIAMTKLGGELATMTEKLAGVTQIMSRLEATVSRHEDHLLKLKS
ncbi:DUF2730 family protein [Pseudogemmobacter bohemicus]|uniref:DUF2730 family protein n=1 Tax=Pseudogemmobacter bohemicus TaxID=2250708 RepID=UPI000DD364D0|nr:DUF2730 family protein [Pseudogemmobacter bohemicus]